MIKWWKVIALLAGPGGSRLAIHALDRFGAGLKRKARDRAEPSSCVLADPVADRRGRMPLLREWRGRSHE